MNDRNEKSQAIEEFKAERSALSAQGEAAASRAIAEVQAAMVIAKRFPRDENEAMARIMKACSRKSLAEKSQYSFPRGGSTVTGPSIRLAEVLAKAWGNIDAGIVELEQRHGESSVMAYAWDTETNTRFVRTFTVKHERGTRQGVQRLTDPRDIYEMTANQGARRLRACILEVIPGDIVEEAVRQCDKTLAGQSKEPLTDRVRRTVALFGKYGVTPEMVAKRLGHILDVTTEIELAELRRIGQTLEDGMASAGQYFDVAPPASKLDDLTAKMTKQASPPRSDAPTAEEMAADEKAMAEGFVLDGEAEEPGSDPNEPPPFDDVPKRGKAKR